jgi:hypothetical protein
VGAAQPGVLAGEAKIPGGARAVAIDASSLFRILPVELAGIAGITKILDGRLYETSFCAA